MKMSKSLLIAGALICAASPAAFAQDSQSKDIVFTTADLRSAERVEEIREEIADVARDVCDFSNVHMSRRVQAEQRCRWRAENRANADLDALLANEAYENGLLRVASNNE